MHAEILLAVVCCLGQVAKAETRVEPKAEARVEPKAEARVEPKAESVDVRYARAQLKLAETNLTQVKQRNKRVSGTVPSNVVADYQHEVDVAKTRLDQALAGAASSDFQAWLKRAEAERSAAESSWKGSVAVNKRAPGTFDPLDIESYRLRAEVAKLQLERGQALAGSDRAAQMEWTIELLDNQVQRLKEESSRTSPLIRSYSIWRY